MPKTGKDTIFDVRPIYLGDAEAAHELGQQEEAEPYARSRKYRKWR
jgi:hypothetical protein